MAPSRMNQRSRAHTRRAGPAFPSLPLHEETAHKTQDDAFLETIKPENARKVNGCDPAKNKQALSTVSHFQNHTIPIAAKPAPSYAGAAKGVGQSGSQGSIDNEELIWTPIPAEESQDADKGPLGELHPRKEQASHVFNEKTALAEEHLDPGPCALAGSKETEAPKAIRVEEQQQDSPLKSEVPDWSSKTLKHSGSDAADSTVAVPGSSASVHDSEPENMIIWEPVGVTDTPQSPGVESAVREDLPAPDETVDKRKRQELTIYQPPHLRAAGKRVSPPELPQSMPCKTSSSPQRSSGRDEGYGSMQTSKNPPKVDKNDAKNAGEPPVREQDEYKGHEQALQIACKDVERGPAPERFSKAIVDPELQARIHVGARLPSLQAQIEATLPDFLRNIPNPTLVCRDDGKEEKEVEKVMAKHKLKSKAHELVLAAPQKPSATFVLGNLDRHALLALQQIGDEARAARRLGAGAGGGSLFTHAGNGVFEKSAQKVGCENPPTRLTDLQKKSFDLLVKDFPDLPIELELYKREDHGGCPTQVSAVITLDKDNLSDFSEKPEEENVQGIYRWRWYNAMVESVGTADSDEQPLTNLHCQLVEWDGEYGGPSMNLDVTAHFDLPSSKLKWFNTWMDAVAHNTSMRPFFVDTTTEEFKSGKGHVTGLRREYIEFPPDSLFKHKSPEYGPINWDMGNVQPPCDPFSKAPLRRLQTSANCSKIAAKEWKKHEEEKQARRELAERRFSEKAKLLKEGKPAPPVDLHGNRANTEGNPWAPKANIYIRPAKKCDAEQIANIYNYYIQHHIQAIEYRQLDEAYWLGQFEESEKERYPFLVAVKKAPQGKGWREPDPWNSTQRRGRKAPTRTPRQEDVLGFVYCECFGFTNGSLEDAAEIQLWVDHAHLRKGIGKTLLDRFLPCVDQIYRSHRGTSFNPPPGEEPFYCEGGRRPAKKVLFNLFYEGKDAKEFMWKKEYLEGVWDFHQCGFYLNIAEKFGKPLNMASFMRESLNTGGENSYVYPGEPLAVPGLIDYV